MYAQQLEAYSNVHKSTLTGRDLEATVLNKAALKLQQVQDSWDDKNLNAKLDEALKYNQMIWTFFQGELAKPDNPLPLKLRENLLNLSVFIDKRSFETMAFPEKEKLNILISINRNIAAGLEKIPE